MTDTKKLGALTILEGPDCGGKSTLANELRKRYGDSPTVLHHGPYSKVTADQLPRFFLEDMLPLLQGFEAQIWDRCWLSEPIYAPHKGRQSRIDVIARRHLERFALRHGAVVVLCLPPLDLVKERWIERKGEEYLDEVGQVEAIYQSYVALRDQTHLPVILFDYSRHTVDQLIREIARVRPPVHQRWHVKSGGHGAAKVILVGDKPTEPTDRDTWFQLPFASFDGRGCSAWLTRFLQEMGIREDQLLWVNASDDLTWLREQHCHAIIALGQEASKALAPLELPHYTVPHPQHHKRFKAHDMDRYELADLIHRHL